uniref:Intraflagellar transport protein 52 C-terminal domain-containing protein n=1 Tax=Romanomermis culicivorax TaxID=13658 RepID=A0A915KVQ7_ROMCU
FNFAYFAGQDDSDISYFIAEAAEIVGITRKLSADSKTPLCVLDYVLQQIVEFKKLDSVDDID